MGPLSNNSRLAREEDLDLEEESSAHDITTSEPSQTDSDSCDLGKKKAKPPGLNHGTIVKKIRDATRHSEDEATKQEKRSMRDAGITKFKAKKVLTPGARSNQEPMASTSKNVSITSNSESLDENE